MRILNTTRGTVLASEAEAAATFWLRLVGLLGRRSLAAGQGVVIRPCRSIHTVFMRFSIDVVYIDRALEVVKIVSNLRPYRFSWAFGGAHAVIELPTGTLERSRTAVRDMLTFEE